MFFDGLRVSTLAMVAAFMLVAVARRDSKPLLAGWVWLTGFELVFQATALSIGHPLPVGRDGPVFFVLLGLVTVPWMTAYGIRPQPTLMLVVAAIWVVWISVGFPVNQHDPRSVNAFAEVLNEAAKTGWALAYLWPLWPRRSRDVAALQAPVGAS